jgi:galactonate dehydratase
VRIAALRTGVVGTPWRNLTFVELRTDEGLTGVGEVRMLGHTDALLGYLAEAERRYLIGADPFAIEALLQRMYRGDYARAGEIAMSAIACVEIACWDIVGQALGQPVHRLLGGAVRDRSARTPTAATRSSASRRSSPPRRVPSWSAATAR